MIQINGTYSHKFIILIYTHLVTTNKVEFSTSLIDFDSDAEKEKAKRMIEESK